MTLKEMKRIVLGLIEELNPESEYLTDDPDIQAKLNDVINLIQLELIRMKKITAFTTEEVVNGQILDLKTIERFYQLKLLRFKDKNENEAPYELIENMVIFHADGVAEIYYYKYPEEIKEETTDDYEFEVTSDVLGIMPYGVAGDLLKSDISANYGKIYTEKYERMLQRLDPRQSMGVVYIEGGVNI